MASPFDSYTLPQIRTLLAGSYTSVQRTAAKFYAGDHWQAGDGYRGPRPEIGHADYATVMAEIERQFTSRNAVAEVVDRHKNGVAGRPALWRIVPRRELADGEGPSADEQRRIDEAQTLLDHWIEARRAARTLGRAVATSAHAGRAPLRLFVPPAERSENGTIPMADMGTSIDRIYLSHPTPEACMITTDQDSQQQAGAYVYRRDNQDLAELTYLDSGNTVLRVIGDADADAWLLRLGGRLTIYEMTRPALISDAVQRQQRLLNLAETMKAHNVVAGGFLERVFLNAQAPGHFEGEGTSRTYVRDPINLGAGTANFLVGVTTKDEHGNDIVASPDVRWRDPVPVNTFAETAQGAYLAILGETHQLHYAIAGDAVASGESRSTAMADFIMDLVATKDEVDSAWTWTLETVLAMAAAFSGQPGYFDGLMVTAEAQIDPGPIGSEMMRATLDLVRDRLISADTGRSWIGIADTDEERQKIEQEQAGLAAGALSQIEALIDGGGA